jgi:outer membrane immunogenic protein
MAMRKLLMSVATLAAVTAGPALAADIPRKAPLPPPVVEYNWTGLYFGGTVGYNIGHADWFFPEFRTSIIDNEVEGWNGGGFVGVNWQIGRVVLSVEANGFWGEISGVSPCPNATFNCHTSIDEVWTVGGRVGYVWGVAGRFMTFVSGGWARATFDTATINRTTGVLFDASSVKHDGWYVGFGMDFPLVAGWIFGTEFRHYRFDDVLHIPVPAGALTFLDRRTVDPDWNSWHVRLSYKLDWGLPPVAARY